MTAALRSVLDASPGGILAASDSSDSATNSLTDISRSGFVIGRGYAPTSLRASPGDFQTAPLPTRPAACESQVLAWRNGWYAVRAGKPWNFSHPGIFAPGILAPRDFCTQVHGAQNGGLTGKGQDGLASAAFRPRLAISCCRGSIRRCRRQLRPGWLLVPILWACIP